MTYTPTLRTLPLIIFAALAAQHAGASGYHFGTQSVSVQATSNASSAEAESPATIFYNPAGLSKLPGTQITANIIAAIPNVKYQNAKGNYYSGETIKNTGTGAETDAGTIANGVIFVPHIYASHQINPQLTAGIGLYVPFGASTEYNEDSIMRYSVRKTELETININPTLAFDFQNGHSIGVGVIGQYLTAKLAKDVDFSSAINTTVGAPVVKGGDADGEINIEGDDWGFGYNLGWMWDINDNARVGLSYRSKISHTIKGSGEWTLNGKFFKQPPIGSVVSKKLRDAGYKEEENGTVKLITPESLSLQGMYKASPELDLFGDITWTRHSRFNTLNIHYENEKETPDATTSSHKPFVKSGYTTLKPNWRDTYKVSLGAAYQVNEKLQLRGGIGYDQSPVRDAKDRIPTMPDSDRWLFSLGAKYNVADNQAINLAYTYLHVKDASVDNDGYCGGHIKDGTNAINCVSDRTTASADYKSNAHFLGLQYTYRF